MHHGDAVQPLIHAGRTYLVRTARALPYQGYAGPEGWQTQVMAPLDLAFATQQRPQVLQALEPAIAEGLMAQSRAFARPCTPWHARPTTYAAWSGTARCWLPARRRSPRAGHGPPGPAAGRAGADERDRRPDPCRVHARHPRPARDGAVHAAAGAHHAEPAADGPAGAQSLRTRQRLPLVGPDARPAESAARQQRLPGPVGTGTRRRAASAGAAQYAVHRLCAHCAV